MLLILSTQVLLGLMMLLSIAYSVTIVAHELYTELDPMFPIVYQVVSKTLSASLQILQQILRVITHAKVFPILLVCLQLNTILSILLFSIVYSYICLAFYIILL